MKNIDEEKTIVISAIPTAFNGDDVLSPVIPKEEDSDEPGDF